MSSLYKVKILGIDKENASVTLRVKVIHPDAMRIHKTAGFALMLIDNFKWKGFPIADEISFEEAIDSTWSRKYAKGFIKAVSVAEQISTIPPDLFEDNNHHFYKTPELWPEEILEITCTDVAWLAHLSQHEEWESTAFNVARSYDACAPIIYESALNKKEDKADQTSAWMPIPSFLFDEGSFFLPKVLNFPKYTASSYVIKEVIDCSTKEHNTVLELHGKYVKHMDSDNSGIFVYNNLLREYRIYSRERNSSGIRSYQTLSDIGKVGLLELKQNYNRHSTLMNYSDLFRQAQPSIKAVQKEGNKISLELIGVYDIDIYVLNKLKVLKMICNNFVETYGYKVELDSQFPLSKLLRFFIKIKEDIYYPKQVLPLIADGIILDYSIEYPANHIEDCDEMDRESLISYFENEQWPCFKIHITLSDEAFGLQLDHVAESRMLIQLNYLSDDIKEITNPILWSDFEVLVD